MEGRIHTIIDIQRIAYNGGSVVMWEGIGLKGSNALGIMNGNMNGGRYIGDILRPHVVLNDQPEYHLSGRQCEAHRARIGDNFLQLNGVQQFEWPPLSPDLSCILGRTINFHINQHARLADLLRRPLQEWAATPQRQIQRLVNSMRRRLDEC